jgi:hypothetical protein
MTLTDTEISENLSEYLSGRLIDGPVQVDDIKKHTEGWSRQTISFTASGKMADSHNDSLLALKTKHETTSTILAMISK